ncbi:MAG TPA: hypothetical protein PK020_03520 [Ilumatobacteraceae bacterium]|nr:hypothetical protein [Ilumatobacteraceae bacterium]
MTGDGGSVVTVIVVVGAITKAMSGGAGDDEGSFITADFDQAPALSLMTGRTRTSAVESDSNPVTDAVVLPTRSTNSVAPAGRTPMSYATARVTGIHVALNDVEEMTTRFGAGARWASAVATHDLGRSIAGSSNDNIVSFLLENRPGRFSAQPSPNAE